MSKKQPVSRFSKAKARTRNAKLTWHNGADVEIHMYARSLRKAAKKLAENLESSRHPLTASDELPIVLLYRQALELHLKALVGEGSNFLKSRTDPISLYRTHSLRWLAQIVCQIIKTVEWEKEFTCEGVASLSAFSALVNDIESLDPITQAVLPSQQHPAFEVRSFANRMDSLLDLLDVTADALAATWDQLSQGSSGEEAFHVGEDFKPTIH
ncbi:MAG: hypothetical protein WBW33_22260 [Bryobacteraceae bacterium]